MKILTLNTHSWMEDNQEDKLHRLAQKIHEEQFDVIALQEINQTAKSSVLTSPFHFCSPTTTKTEIKEDNFCLLLVQYLEETFHDTYYWSWAYNHLGFDKYDEGVALLMKQPFTPFTYRLSQATDPLDYHTRIALGATAEIDGVTHCFVSLHASWWTSPEGELCFPYEAQRLLDLHEKTSIPMILMGDFNNPSQIENEGYALLCTHWYDTYHLTTHHDGEFTMGGNIAGWEHNTTPLRIDFIFTSDKLNVTETHVYFDNRNEAPVSDHFGYAIETKD